MEKLRTGLGNCLVIIGILMWNTFPAVALSVVPFTPLPVQTTAPLTISGYGFDGMSVFYVQVFNKSDEVTNLAGWQLEYQLAGSEEYQTLVTFDGLMRPSNYVLAGDRAVIDGVDFEYEFASDNEGMTMANLRLLPPIQFKSEQVKLPIGQEPSFWRRNVSESTGNYLSTFSQFIPAEDTTLFGGGLYDLPDETGILFSEILAHPRDCSPLDLLLDCKEYVKLYNPTTLPVDTSLFRLRVGFQAQSSTSSNTFLLGGIIEPGGFRTINTAADGRPITLTNTGGFVWLEDMYGVKTYAPTVQEYTDASSTTRKGQAWAYDVSDGAWKWTTRPMPGNGPSIFPSIAQVHPVTESGLTPCAPNQYRNLETNRCRLLPVPDIETLAACPAGQFRNPETNRCRKIEAVASLVPCDEGEERNPDTNRCRRVAVTEPSLVPCKPNQERNPETNRCRNKAVVSESGAAPFPVEPIAQSGTSLAGWWVLGGVLAVGVGYGIGEWRAELLGVSRRLLRHVPFMK